MPGLGVARRIVTSKWHILYIYIYICITQKLHECEYIYIYILFIIIINYMNIRVF